MYSYSQLLLRNTILGILFNMLMIVMMLSFFSIALSSSQIQMQPSLSANIDLLQENKQLEKLSTIINLTELDSLIVKKSSSTLYNYEDKTTSFIGRLISSPPSSFTTEQGLVVNFNVSSKHAVALITRMILVSLLASLALIFLACSLSVRHTKKLVFVVNKQIKDGIAQVISTEELQPTNQIIDIPELVSGLKTMKELIASQLTDASALEEKAYIEPLTKLENRNRFVQFFANDENQIEFGVLAITRCSELQTINQIHGYNEGDKYICQVAEIIKTVISPYQGSNVYRLNSSDFATLLPNVTLKEAENAAKEMTSRFNEYQHASDLDSVGYTGLVYFTKDNPLGELLALADTGISVAQTQQMNSWFAQTDTDILHNPSASYGNQNWRQEIDNVLENQRVKLLVQHIKPNNRNNRVYGEILARFLNSNDEMLPTASFIAMAEKLDKIVAVDKMIIEKVFSEIKEKNLYEQFFGINISARSIHDEHFLIWLERRLLKEATIASKLIFEITEYGLQQNIKTSKRYIDMLHRVGSRITVERFGVGLTSFKFFRDLKPDFIKMDSTYTRDIDEDKNNQYFIRLMVDLAHRLSITVLAESVESQEEKFTLEKLFIDGCQGYYLGKPEEI